ncbi:substrate-binding domain-containing protein [Burkholderia sp. A1]|uniref:substrate-binding domain-containing protein n=1 Tax=Burkholderia sp. A1 TaxID=148446 RepID=UPI001F56A02F|nr:substrate-binding domain-containing protein [Burkholderia sp. A1]
MASFLFNNFIRIHPHQKAKRRRQRLVCDGRDAGGDGDRHRRAELPIPITTVRVPSAEIGKQAARLILAQLDGQAEVASIGWSAELMVRASCAPPRKGD